MYTGSDVVRGGFKSPLLSLCNIGRERIDGVRGRLGDVSCGGLLRAGVAIRHSSLFGSITEGDARGMPSEDVKVEGGVCTVLYSRRGDSKVGEIGEMSLSLV